MPHPIGLNVAVCGAGAFGRNHIRILQELAASGHPVRLVAIVDPALDRAAAAISATEEVPGSSPSIRRPVRTFSSTEALLAAVQHGELPLDAAVISSPTATHHPVSALLLTAGIHVLVEKPIAASLAEADELIALAQRHRRILQVGHLERFNPAVQALKPLLRGPMFFEAHRLSIFSPRSLDVDVVLDLMIHDLDIVLQLAQSPVAHVQAVGLPVLSRKTDIANVRVEFASGAVANFTASRVSTERVRKLRFFQPHQYLSVDYARQDLLVIEVQPPAGSPSATATATNTTQPSQAYISSPEEIPAANTPGAPRPAPETWVHPTLGITKPTITPGEPLRLEIESFLEAIRTGASPEVTGTHARSALALALQIQSAIDTHAAHAGLQAFVRP